MNKKIFELLNDTRIECKRFECKRESGYNKEV